MTRPCPRPRVLACRLEPSSATFSAYAATEINGPERAALLGRQLIGDLAREHFVAMYVSAVHCVVGYDAFTTGGVTSVHVDPAAAVRGVILAGQPALITVHNHPSGRLDPSADDRRIWAEIAGRCACVGVEHLDDLVVTVDGYWSRSEGRAARYPE